MPVLVTGTDKPTFIAKPDMRFATTFLSLKFRDYAVKGESIMDKSTGEIFTKRPADGRVVSFFQNKKYLQDMALRLRVLLSNNTNFTYDKESQSGYYVNTDYDSMSILNEQRLDILTHDFVAPNVDSDTTTQFKFNLSADTNGFFFRCTSRDSDKALIEFLTHEYNERLENYTGSDPDYIAEHQKFADIPAWKLTNVKIEYTVKITDIDNNTLIYTCTSYARINEETCIYLPSTDIASDFPHGYVSALVTIKSVCYDKIHFMVNHTADFGPDFVTNMNKFKYPDGEAYVDYYNISYFIDKSSDLLMLGNEFVVALLEIYYIRNLMMKLTSLERPAEFNVSTVRPDDADFAINTVWGERFRDVFKGGIEIDNDTETDIKLMESVFSGINYNPTIIQEDPTDINNFYIRNTATTYTDAQINGMLNNIQNISENNITRIVVSADSNDMDNARRTVTNNGTVLENVSTAESSD